MIIKIHGERNTGTHYLMQLLQSHLDVIEKKGSAIRILSDQPVVDLQALGELGWKHRLVTPEFLQNKGVGREAILIVTLTKNPYSWLLSLHKRPYAPIHLRSKVIRRDENNKPRINSLFNRRVMRLIELFGRPGLLFLSRFPQWCEYEKLAFGDFIRAKWHAEFHEGKDEGFKNAIHLWNEKNKAYLELEKSYNVLSLTYEELLVSPETTLRRITDHLQYPLKEFRNLHQAAKTEDSDKNHHYYQDYYLNERWRSKLSADDIQQISSQLDPEVMQAFAYSFLSE